jgi:hypothetical protein
MEIVLIKRGHVKAMLTIQPLHEIGDLLKNAQFASSVVFHPECPKTHHRTRGMDAQEDFPMSNQEE